MLLAGPGAEVEADAHPPKSSSAATVGWTELLFVDGPEIGAPQPPEISSGVILLGTLPSSTFGADGFGCAGAAQASVSALPHGFDTEVPAKLSSGRVGTKDGLGAGAEMVGEERLNGELKLAGGLASEGEGIAAALDGTGGLGGEAAVAKPPKASSLNRSAGNALVTGFDAGGDVVVGCVAKEKSSRADDVVAPNGFAARGFVVVVDEKKSPPLSGGGEVTCGAAGVDLIVMDAGAGFAVRFELVRLNAGEAVIWEGIDAG